MSTIAPDIRCAFRLLGWNNGVYTYPIALGTPTPETLTAYDQLALVSESVRQENRYLLDDTLRNSSGYTSQDVIAKLFGGQIVLEAGYTGLNQLIAACMGMEKFRTTSALEYPDYLQSGSGASYTGIAETVSAEGFVYESAGVSSSWKNDWFRLESLISSDYVWVRRIIAISVPLKRIYVSPGFDFDGVNIPFSIARRFRHVYEFSKNLCAEAVNSINSNALKSTDWIARVGVLGIDKGLSVWEYQAVMVNSLTFSISGGKMSVTAELIPFGLDRRTTGRNSSSSTWGFSPLDYAPVIFARMERVLHGDGVFRIGQWYEDDPLTDSNRLGISSFSLTINNNLIGDTIATAGAPYIAQPRRRGLRSVTGSFTVPRQQSETNIGRLENQMGLMADYKFTGPIISGAAQPTQFNFYLRKLKLQRADVPIEGQSALQQRYTFQCLQPELDTAGMPAHWDSLEQSELMIETYDSYPFNNFMGQHFTPV